MHHVEAPEQVVTPGEELWVKIIDVDLERRRISLSIKQAAEGGTVSAEYQDLYGEHAFDDQGNYIGPEFEPGHEPETGAAAVSDGEAPDAGAIVGAAPDAGVPEAEVAEEAPAAE